MATDKFIHSSYRNFTDVKKGLARLPPNCTLVFNQSSDGNENVCVARLESSGESVEEAVDKFLAGLPTQSMCNVEELFPNQEG